MYAKSEGTASFESLAGGRTGSITTAAQTVYDFVEWI